MEHFCIGNSIIKIGGSQVYVAGTVVHMYLSNQYSLSLMLLFLLFSYFSFLPLDRYIADTVLLFFHSMNNLY